MKLADVNDPKAMAKASKLFVELLKGKTVSIENVESRLSCGHEEKHRVRRGDGKSYCRACNRQYQRDRYLSTSLENTREKLARLEAECREKGIVV